MAREIANASLDFRGVPHLLARPSKGDPEGVVIWSEIQPIIDDLNQKLDSAQLEIELQRNNAGIVKRFTLTGGVSEVRTDAADGEDYTFTTFRFATGFVDNAGLPTTDFEDFAMATVLAPWSNQGFRYEFRKELPDFAVVEFQSLIGAFPNDRVRISLARIPESVTPETVLAVLGQRYTFNGGANLLYSGDGIQLVNPDQAIIWDGGTDIKQLKFNPVKGYAGYVSDTNITLTPLSSDGFFNTTARSPMTLQEYQTF